MLVTLRALGAVEGVLEADDSSDLRLSEALLEGVEPLSFPFAFEGVRVAAGRSAWAFLGTTLWLWMSLSMSFALRLRTRSELPCDALTGEAAAARALWTG